MGEARLGGGAGEGAELVEGDGIDDTDWDAGPLAYLSRERCGIEAARQPLRPCVARREGRCVSVGRVVMMVCVEIRHGAHT